MTDLNKGDRALLAGWMLGLAEKLAAGEPANADDVMALHRVSRMLANDAGATIDSLVSRKLGPEPE